MTNATRHKLRIGNVVFWAVAWAAIVVVTDTWHDGVLLGLEAVAPAMFGLFVHIALRDHPEGQA